MNRLQALALGLLVAVLPPLDAGVASTREWRFEVFLDEEPIGFHSFELSRVGDMRLLRSEAQFRVRLLGFTVYDYAHRSTEFWQQDCLQRIDASTDDNGEALFVRGNRDGEQLVLKNTAGTADLTGCVMTFAYWNPAILEQQRLLNVQTGEYLNVSVRTLGENTLQLQGRNVPAQHYLISTGEDDIELWYSEDRDWLGLSSTTRSGRQLHYRRLTEPLATRSLPNE